MLTILKIFHVILITWVSGKLKSAKSPHSLQKRITIAHEIFEVTKRLIADVKAISKNGGK